MERLPIRFFSKREEDNMRVEGGGSGSLPSFVLDGESLIERAQKLDKEIESLVDNVAKINKMNIPAVIVAEINQDALAKSHRSRINTLFAGDGRNNVIGLIDEKTIKIMISSLDLLKNIKSKISQPSEYAYELSCIERIDKFQPKIVKSELGDYKVKLIDFQDYALNKALRDPDGKLDVYNGVTQKLDEYNFWHSNIKVATNVVVRKEE